MLGSGAWQNFILPSIGFSVDHVVCCKVNKGQPDIVHLLKLKFYKEHKQHTSI